MKQPKVLGFGRVRPQEPVEHARAALLSVGIASSSLSRSRRCSATPPIRSSSRRPSAWLRIRPIRNVCRRKRSERDADQDMTVVSMDWRLASSISAHVPAELVASSTAGTDRSSTAKCRRTCRWGSVHLSSRPSALSST